MRLALHACTVGFGLRSQIRLAPGKEFLVRLRFDIPARSSAVAVVSLASHEPSPLARQRVGPICDMAGSRQLACAPAAAPVESAASA